MNPSPEPNSSIKGSVSNYNVAIALAPGNTDLVVSVLNSDGNPDNILIPNVPVQEPFRVGVVIMGTVFEAYLNGKLVSTRTFTSGAPGNYAGPFQPPSGAAAKSINVGNLLIWNRVASAGNIRYAKPSLMSMKSTDSGTADSCTTFSGSLAAVQDSLSKSANAIASSATTSLGPVATTSTSAITDLGTSK